LDTANRREVAAEILFNHKRRGKFAMPPPQIKASAKTMGRLVSAFSNYVEPSPFVFLS
jgi:hypothetical protein